MASPGGDPADAGVFGGRVLLRTMNESVELGGIMTMCVRSLQAVWRPNRTESQLAVIGRFGEICSTSPATSAGARPNTGPNDVALGP